MAKVDMVDKLNINEVVRLIEAVGAKRTIIMNSEPGCGKTSTLNIFKEKYGEKYDYVYVDCACKDLADIAINVPDRDTKQLECYVASIFKLIGKTSAKPKIVLLDELMKAPKMLQIIFMRLILERMVGDVPLPEGSLVYGTSNNPNEGLGDTIMAHGVNRLIFVPLKKPTAEEWVLWGVNNNVSALTRAWAIINPSAFNSYQDMTAEELNNNGFIYNPKRAGQRSFLSPRSLAAADDVIKQRKPLGDKIVRTALVGAVGPVAANSLMSFFLIEKDMVNIRDVIAAPKTVEIPENFGALLMTIYSAVDVIEVQDELDKFMIFMNRLPKEETRALFYSMCCQSKKMVRLVKNNSFLTKWMLSNFNLFT